MLTNLSEKPCRSKRKRKLLGNPLQRRDQHKNHHQQGLGFNSCRAKTMESKNPHCFQVSKFLTRLLRHSQQVYREEDGRVHYDQLIDEWNKKQSDNTGNWSEEVKKHFVQTSHRHTHDHTIVTLAQCSELSLMTRFPAGANHQFVLITSLW